MSERAKNNGDNGLRGKKRIFLSTYAQYGNVGRAAEVAGIIRQTVYKWLKASEVFKQAFEEAREAATDRLEEEARRRAYDGVSKPVYYKGNVVGTIKEYSDTLLIVLLKANRPDKYRERQDIRHSGDRENPITYVQVPPQVGV